MKIGASLVFSLFVVAPVLGLTPTAEAGTLSAITVVGGQGVGAGANELLNPTQVALDSRGDLFVVDNADRVAEYPLSAATGTYATTGTVVAGLASPIDATGVALDSNGDLFVSDGINNRVMEFPFNASTGTYPASGVTVAGVGGQGSGATQLNGPSYLALDSKGDLFVADTGNNRVQEFTWNSSSAGYSASGITVAGAGGAGSGSSQLSAPGPLALDASGDLFVADNGNHRVQEFAINAGTGAYSGTGTTAYSEAGIPLTFGQLAFDKSGDLFLTWTYPQAEPVVELTPNAANGTYSAVSITAPLQNTPLGIAVDASGNLLVSEGNLPFLPSSVPANFVQELSPTSTAGTYSAAASLSQVQGTGVSPLSSPSGVAVDSQGNLYVANGASNTVLEFPLNASTGTYSATGTTVAGVGGTGSGASQLNDPDAIALDSHGNLFIADASNNRVVEYTRNAATGSFSATGTTVAGAGGTGSGPSQLNWPAGLALDSHGNLFIADENNKRVLEYTLNAATGTYSSTGTTVATSSSVDSVALDSHNNLFVGNPADNQVVEYALNTATGTYAATGAVVAQLGATGPEAIAAGPGTILVDAQGDIFAGGGYYTDEVVEFPVNTSTGQYPSTPTVLLSGPGAGPSQVTYVWALAVDTHGDLFIADEYNQRIQELAGIAASAPAPPPAPAVTAVSPATGPAAGGTTVTITGSNLTGGTVTFGGTAATAVSCTASSCTATSPAGTGTVNVTVTTTSGTSTTSTADQFTYTASPPPAPAVTAVSPASGPAAGGTTVTITGSNLTGGTVAFGSTAATAASCTASSCTATSPAGTGTVNVTVTTTSGTSATSTADQFTYTASAPANLIPNPGFESPGVPADYWGSTLARSQAVAHSGSWSLAQTLTSSSGGWDMDSNPSWYAPVSSSKSYTAGIWVYATATVKVNLNLDLLTSSGGYVDSATGPNVTLTAGTWTHLTMTGITPTNSEVYAAMEPNFLKGTKGTVIYWDDMSLTSP